MIRFPDHPKFCPSTLPGARRQFGRPRNFCGRRSPRPAGWGADQPQRRRTAGRLAIPQRDWTDRLPYLPTHPHCGRLLLASGKLLDQQCRLHQRRPRFKHTVGSANYGLWRGEVNRMAVKIIRIKKVDKVLATAIIYHG